MSAKSKKNNVKFLPTHVCEGRASNCPWCMVKKKRGRRRGRKREKRLREGRKNKETF
jgi:tRNA A37 methylthiotransferase MiaB